VDSKAIPSTSSTLNSSSSTGRKLSLSNQVLHVNVFLDKKIQGSQFYPKALEPSNNGVIDIFKSIVAHDGCVFCDKHMIYES